MQFSRDPYTYIDRVKECRDKVDGKGEDYEVRTELFLGKGVL